MKLIQKYLPNFEYREHRGTSIAVPPAKAYHSMRTLDLNDSRLIRAVFTTRRFLYGIFSKSGQVINSAEFGPLVDWVLKLGWSVLEEVPHRELVVGAVTQPWAANVVFQGLSGPDFMAFTEPGFAKIAWNIEVHEVRPGVTRLSSETRVALTDPVARHKFRYYWFLFNPGIRLIRWLALRMVKSDLKHQQTV
ncbi:MAG: hypothetical protein OER04_19840 [Cyclobacteriaceae bacterium]|nr:hypothetical protein [Cyclobacteriaceae bacterium]